MVGFRLRCRFGSRRRSFPAPQSIVALLTAAACLACPGRAAAQLPATSADVFQGGTQPVMPGVVEIIDATACFLCHGDFDPAVEPYTPWSASMMGQSARDPMFWACLAVANQDVAGAGEFCIRCHIPIGFLGGRGAADGSQLVPEDFQSINCNFCHRLVNAAFPVPPDAPAEDHAILKALDAEGLITPQGSNARFVIDPSDSRRGPFAPGEFIGNPHNPVPIIESPFHRKAEFCWTCHDVSNPLYTRQPDDTYVLGALGEAHPTGSQDDMFPLHRIYREWQNSYYLTQGGVQHNGRFGGNHPTGIMGACQDCDMPDQQGKGCALPAYAERPDVPQHSFIGANTWGLKAVRAVDADGDNQPDFPDFETGLTQESVDAHVARNTDMLEKASDLFLSTVGDQLKVRVLNQSGHKLPTGFPDGRRMWINVKWYDPNDSIAVELGEFDFSQGQIVNPQDTTVFEIKLGIDAEQAAITGLPEGETFHFMLANAIAKDNRIPPRGWSTSVAEIFQTMPVGADYVDGQHWADTFFDVPSCASRVVVTVYYQLVSQDYIMFLRDTNVTNNSGQVAFDMWDHPDVGNHGAPVVMDMAEFIIPGTPSDIDEDGLVSVTDLLSLLGQWGPCLDPQDCASDLDCDGIVGATDLLVLLGKWTVEAQAIPDGGRTSGGRSPLKAQETGSTRKAGRGGQVKKVLQ